MHNVIDTRRVSEDKSEADYWLTRRCAHRGEQVGETPCNACGGRKQLPLYQCAVFGTCTEVGKSVDRSAGWCGGGCPSAQIRRVKAPKTVDTAPLRGVSVRKPWEGSAERKPWEYPVQVVMACLDTPELVEVALALWRLQTVKPYFCIVDTGSTPANLEKLKALRADDLDIITMDCRGFSHPSEPVAMALDLAAGVCKQQYQIQTHVDAFPMSRDLVEELLMWCGESQPVVGYEISPRLKGFQGEHSPGMVGHTLTALHMPTIRRHGIVWNMERAHEQNGVPRDDIGANDTEIGFNLQLREVGIVPLLIGHDENHTRQITKHFDHFRSYTSIQLYGHGERGRVHDWAKLAVEDARARIQEWETRNG